MERIAAVEGKRLPAASGALDRRAFAAGALGLVAGALLSRPLAAWGAPDASAEVDAASGASVANSAIGSAWSSEAWARADELIAAADLSSGKALVESLAAQASPVVAAEGESIADAAGNAFAMPVDASRIVCLNNNVYDTLCAFGQAERVVGVSDTTTLDPSTPNVPSVGDLSEPSVELVIETAPSLVLAYSARLDDDIASQIESAGIPIARADLYKPAPCHDELVFLGNVLGCQQQAAELNAVIEGMQALVAQRVADVAEPVRTYWEIYADYKSCGAGSGGDQLMGLAGVENLAGSETGAHVKISDEWVIEANPQLIVRESSTLKGITGAGVTDAAAAEALYDSLVERPGWSTIDAVQEGRIIILDTGVTTNPVGFALAPLFIAQAAYPELTADMPPAADVLDAMLERFWPNEDRAGLYAYTR